MTKPKLQIEHAREETASAAKRIKSAATFREVDAIKSKADEEDALRRTRTAAIAIKDEHDESRSRLNAIQATVDLRLARLLAKVAEKDVLPTAKAHGCKSNVGAFDLRAVGSGLTTATVRQIQDAARKHHREVPIRDMSAAVGKKPAHVKQACARLADVPSFREAVKAVVVPDWKPSPPVKPAAPVEVADPTTLEYVHLARELRTVADRLIAAAAKHLRAPSGATAKAVIDTEIEAVTAFKAMRRNGVGPR
jgi:hypothetical protein